MEPPPLDFSKLLNERAKIPNETLTFITEISVSEKSTICKMRMDSKEIAVKTIRPTNDNIRRELHEYTEIQGFLMCSERGRHPNVIEFLGMVVSNDTSLNRRMFAMEYISGGSLDRVIYRNDIEYSDREIFSWIEQAASGLQFLHDLDIIHFDVKPSNMLLNEERKRLKISSFGMAKRVGEQVPTGGTLEYQAPEILRQDICGIEVDVYALAISAWEMYYREKPYKEYATFRLKDEILDGTRPTVFFDYTERLLKLLTRCWDDKPDDRWIMRDIVNYASDPYEYQRQRNLFLGELYRWSEPLIRTFYDCFGWFMLIVLTFYAIIFIILRLPNTVNRY